MYYNKYMFIKKLLKNTIKETLGFFYYNLYRKFTQTPGNRALIYHAFGSKYKHDTYGFSIDVAQFKEHIKFYTDNYNIINTSVLTIHKYKSIEMWLWVYIT